MDPRDFDFTLRTGHDLVNPAPTSVDWNNTLTLLALAMVFTERATIDAGTYVKASGRRWVTPKDMQLALMHNALPRTNFYTQDNLSEKVGEWRTRLMSPEESDDAMSEEEEEEEETEEEWTAAERSDDETVQELIDGMNRAAEEWASWQPTDQIGLIVHRAIEKCLQS